MLMPLVVYLCSKSNIMKKVLVIHPDDRSTDFLKPIYEGIPYKTVITGGVTSDVITKEIMNHDRIIMMGHGSPSGLFSMGKFSGIGPFVINDLNAFLLKDKECVFIWCNADIFVIYHKLKGFYSGMFISEVDEAVYCGLPDTEQKEVSRSNYTFADILGEHINLSIEEMYIGTVNNYGVMSESSNVVKYNCERLYCNTDKMILEEVK